MINFENILKNGSSKEIINIISKKIELFDDNAMWRGRTLSLLIPIVNALVWIRDIQDKEITAQSFVDSFYLNEVRSLYEMNLLPKDLKTEVYKYLNSLPTYNLKLNISEKQADTAIEHHFYLQFCIAHIIGDFMNIGNYFCKNIKVNR